MQRVVTVAGNSVVGTQGGRLNGRCYRREEGYPWLGETRTARAAEKDGCWRRKSVANWEEVLYHKWFL